MTEFHKSVSSGRSRKQTLVTIILCAVLIIFVLIAGSMLSPYALQSDFTFKNLAPSIDHLFGTDWMGRDMLARTVAGLSLSIFVGILASAISCVLAFVLAVIAVFGPRGADGVIVWLIDLVSGIPHLILLVLVSYALGRGFVGVTVAVAVTHWPSLARVLRAEMMQVRSKPYMKMSQALGTSKDKLVLTHVLPTVLPQLIVGAALAFPHAILHEASITFLGFGLSVEQPAIGVILSESMKYLSAGYWWLALLPGAALLLVVLVFEHMGLMVRRLTSARMAQE